MSEEKSQFLVWFEKCIEIEAKTHAEAEALARKELRDSGSDDTNFDVFVEVTFLRL
jgi:hypothetical protein